MNILKNLFCIGAGLFLSGCVHHVLKIPEATPTGDVGQPIVASTSVFKGGKNEQKIECDTHRIKQIEIKQNVGQSLLNVLTLGTVFNLDVTYDCAKIESGEGEI